MTDYTALFEALEDHGNLSKACRDLDIVRPTFLLHCDNDPDLADKYARSKQRGLDKMMEDLIDKAITDPAKDRLDWDRKRWHASKLFPKQYGDKLQHTGDGGGPVVVDWADRALKARSAGE